MDKAELSKSDVEMLLEWRDEHKELVRALPASLKAVEICFPHNDIRIKGIRGENTLKLQLSAGYKTLCIAEFEIAEDRLCLKKKRNAGIDEDILQSALTVYCSLMALMAYGSAAADEEIEPKGQKAKDRSRGDKSPSGKQKRTTYILRKTQRGLQMLPKGAHASPHGVFTVRGHYRHYKNGKVVWIGAYQKGKGTKKSKTYKLGK